jgi:iron complex outermembrane receptor protein
MLQNGAGVMDASSLSFDHAVSVEPLVVKVQGRAWPAALFSAAAPWRRGESDRQRIPQSAIRSVGGRVEGRVGGAERERAGAAVFSGRGSLVLHADVYRRNTTMI